MSVFVDADRKFVGGLLVEIGERRRKGKRSGRPDSSAQTRLRLIGRRATVHECLQQQDVPRVGKA